MLLADVNSGHVGFEREEEEDADEWAENQCRWTVPSFLRMVGLNVFSWLCLPRCCLSSSSSDLNTSDGPLLSFLKIKGLR